MFRSISLRRSSFCLATALLVFGLGTPAARAENKDMIQLQTQVRELTEAVARLQQSNDERMGVLKDLVQQTADSVNKMSVQVNGMKLATQNAQDAMTAKNDQISSQVQSLNDSLDELKARMAKMEKTLNDVQSQQQSANAILNNLPAGGGVPSASTPSNGPAPGQPLPSNGPAAGSGPSSAELYRTAYNDYMTAKYPLATSEFGDLIKAYPDDNLSGNAYFYLGEMDLRAQKPANAIKDYDHLLERYPDNVKIPAAHLHKAQAMLALQQKDAGVRELRALIQRFPNSPEASQARLRLAALHVPVVPVTQ